MDLFDLLLQAGAFTAAVVFYLIVVRKPTKRKRHYREPGWNYPLKIILAWFAVHRWKSKLPSRKISEAPFDDQKLGSDDITLRVSASDGASVLLRIRKLCGRTNIAEVVLYLQTQDGTKYKLPQHPETAVSEWVHTQDGWSASGLKIQILESQTNLRILYNGILTRVHDNVTQHVKLNLIWASATSFVRHPEDWNIKLAAQTLALEPWRDGSWPQMLNKFGESGGSWMQWGALQGRFQSFDANGGIEKSEYLRLRGAKERSWSLGSKDLRRTLTLTATASDGTAIQICGSSYYDNVTQCISGNVRFPNFMVTSITSTDLVLSDFCEGAEEIPNTYTINISTSNNRTLKVILRINKHGGRTFSGVPHQQEQVYRTFAVEINGYHGTGILELGYDILETNSATPANNIIPLPVLKWLDEREVGEMDYCVPFDAIAATCTNYVGGKGASLALLASVQHTEGFCVPPGFCVTSKALNKQLDGNAQLINAISEIERSNEDYKESIFKEKCEKTVNLFVTTEVVEEVKDKILEHLNELRKKATDKTYGPQLRFAVRSSAIGEDSEALSAAGQNETILGCASDDDVIRAVQKCWASMFAFTSSYYRRQNGQPCLCGGGVVVQALVAPRAAGVMFTRHPQHGDPARILVTANYGLGESVVSGSVEPDTIIIRRGADDNLSIDKIVLGSKTHRVITSTDGVSSESVPESERTKACLSDSEILKLAQIAISQEKLWGAGRDIEWAVHDDDIFLLQARPITSLERWTEEELLHEFDFPIMSDDELVTFANTGEVLPKPITPLSYDMVYRPLERGLATLIARSDGYDKNVIVTHNRCAIALYNSVYRRVTKEIDINMRMLEMSIHGHKVADDDILQTALHRRQPHFTDKFIVILDMIKSLIISKWVMNDTIKRVNNLNLNADTGNALELFNKISAAKKDMTRYSGNHGVASVASTFTQFIAMSVLLEDRKDQLDFSPEVCCEIGKLLSSGGVLSAEVPHALAKLARELEDSGKLEEFRRQDPNTALAWLNTTLPNVYDAVSKFLDEHGHRAIMEFDLSTKPWVLVPEELMKVLMNIKPTKEHEHQVKTSDEIIASLKTPKKSSTRKVLRWILPYCHRAVRHREATKAHLILAVHKLRIASLSLGRLLVRSWYLPYPDLVFYFRLHELRDYITTRDSVLLKKAFQRHQYYPGWCKLKFAEIIKGWPQPLTIEKPKITAGEVRLEATSVCDGEVIARACVVKDLSEISHLQQGDVLITHSTDIGWSPYFPLLSGIVTELGGLISHGAVIAREYGLPCIVGATHATDLFATGDTVRLSGIEGLVQTVSVSEREQTDAK